MKKLIWLLLASLAWAEPAARIFTPWLNAPPPLQISGGGNGGTPTTVQVNGTAVQTQSPVNFQDGSFVHMTNPSGGTITVQYSGTFANLACSPTRAGDIIYYTGSVWACFSGNNVGTNFLQENSSGVPSWAAAATTFASVAPTPTRAGDVIYWNGASWVNLAGNNVGTNFLQENSSGVPSWAATAATVAWSGLSNAAADLTLANAGFNTIINQTSAVSITHANTTAAVVGTAQSSPIFKLCGQGWETGTPANTTDCWTLQNVIGNGANPTVRLTFANTGGSTGVVDANFPQLSTGASPPTACGSATGCQAFAEASTAGTPTTGQDYKRADSATHGFRCSLNGAAEGPCDPQISGTIVPGHLVSWLDAQTLEDAGNPILTPAGSGNQANYVQSFTAQTSVTILGATHNLGTPNIIVACWDNASPAKRVEPSSVTVNSLTYDVAIAFAASQSGSCVLNGSSGTWFNYAQSFTSQASVVLLGGAHTFGHANLEVACYDASAPAKQIGLASYTVNSTFDVTVNFAVNQSGYCVVGGSSGDNGPNYSQSFTAQTSVTLAGTSSALDTIAIVPQCYDNASPANALQPAQVTLNSTSYDVVVTFGASQTGSCVLNGTGMRRTRTVRASTGSIGATTRTEILLSWPGAFADTSYTATCSVEDSSTAAATQGLTYERVRTKSASQIGVVINNPTAGSLTGTVECMARHD